ncbi:hypothetical protein K8I85_14360 [bacterium]|nr:hypothetical protein [bacterium]
MDGKRSFTEVLIAWRGLVYRITITAVLGAVVVSLLLPNWFTATAVITPPSEGDSGMGLMAIMDQVSGGGGVSRARSLLKRTPEIDLVIGVLKSRRVRGEIADRFDLMEVYDSKTREHAIKQVGMNLSVSTTPEGFIQVNFTDRDKQRAADVANAFLESLDRYNRETSVADARRTREFVANRLDEVRGRLDTASADLRRFQEEYGAIQISEQTRVTVEAMAALEGERTQLEIEKGVLENYSRGDVPRVREIEARIDEIEKRIAMLRGSTIADSLAVPRTAGADSDVMIPLGEFPRLGLQFADLKREVMAQEKVLEFLMAQFEEARIREARDLQTVSVLDAAVPPIRKSRPQRTIIVLLTAALGLALAIGTVFGAEALDETMRRRPEWRDSGEAKGLVRLVALLRKWGGPAAT